MTMMVCFFVAVKFSPFLKLQSLEINCFTDVNDETSALVKTFTL